MKFTKGDRIFAVITVFLGMGLGLYGIWLHSEKFHVGQYESKAQWANRNGTKNSIIFEIKPDGQYTEHVYWGIEGVCKNVNPKVQSYAHTYTIHPDSTCTRHSKGTYVVASNDIDVIQDSGPNSFPRFRVRKGRFTRAGLEIVRQFSVTKMEDIGTDRMLHDSGVIEGKAGLYVKIK